MSIRSSIRSKILKNISNFPGWRSTSRIVVFESDDWGTVRSSSIEAVKKLIIRGVDFISLDAERYSFNDSLETSKDLEMLFEVLSSVKDHNRRNAVFTAMSIVANPDFNAIKNNNFSKYILEPVIYTYKKTEGCEDSLQLALQGIESRIFIPQFHGREHLNVSAWMNALSNRDPETLQVFDEGMWGYVNKHFGERRINYQEAFNFHNPAEIPLLKEILNDGLKLFKEIYGYSPTYFIPPNGPFPNVLEKDLARNGIVYIAQPRIQYEPIGFGKYRKSFHYLGMRNKHGQIYLTRNCFFEPCSSIKNDWVSSCMKEIESAFLWRKPAIISTHRVNYVGSLNPENRRQGLLKLETLLKSIIKSWPDVVFMSSVELGDMIMKSKS